VQHFIDQGEELFIELGPGRVLAGLMRRIDRKKTALSFADAEGLEKVVEALAE
jgi:[acyl-carrier-protein] S-malonyltransferase